MASLTPLLNFLVCLPMLLVWGGGCVGLYETVNIIFSGTWLKSWEQKESEAGKMSTIGWTQSVNASSVLDKIQHTQQSQVELAQVQAKEKALQEDRLRQTTVNNTPDSEKIRLREERDRRREEGQKKKQNSASEEGPGEGEALQEENEEGLRKIDITV